MVWQSGTICTNNSIGIGIMKKVLLLFLSHIIHVFNHFFIHFGCLRPKVIIYMDGGICSQMFQYLNGQYYKDANIKILYDTTWFVKNGKDKDGKFDRKLELTEMFPDLPFFTLTNRRSWFYRLFFASKQKDGFLPHPDRILHTTYLGGFYDMYPDDLQGLFTKYFNPETLRSISVSIPRNVNGVNCAVHVRRGDLANREDRWYKKVPNEYFINAIRYVHENNENVHFYFFSDELDWVETNLCNHIDVSYRLMRGNKAYEDLILISECDIVIASQGSFGRWGARLNGCATLIVPSKEAPQGFMEASIW